MMRVKDLHGRAVIDLDSARKLGSVDEILLDPDGRRIAGLVLGEGGSPLGGQHHTIVPASALHAIGEDAIAVRDPRELPPTADDLGALPRLSKLLGRKVVTQGGELLGSLEDVLFEGTSGRISGYLLGTQRDPGNVIEGWFGRDHSEPRYVRADTDVRIGEDLIVVPDNAMIEGAPPDLDIRAGEPREQVPGRNSPERDRTSSTHDTATRDYAEADRLLRTSAADDPGRRGARQR
jgi:sporulation protein YlmC with PRC-barrel domain